LKVGVEESCSVNPVLVQHSRGRIEILGAHCSEDAGVFFQAAVGLISCLEVQNVVALEQRLVCLSNRIRWLSARRQQQQRMPPLVKVSEILPAEISLGHLLGKQLELIQSAHKLRQWCPPQCQRFKLPYQQIT